MPKQPQTLTQAERLTMAQRLVEAISAGDEAAEHELADAIGRSRFTEMYAELDRITREMQDTLCNAGVTNQLARLAHKELPGAQLRLTQVMDLTEDAANKTLNAVEQALPLAQRMVNMANDTLVDGIGGSPAELPAEFRQVLETVSGDAGLLRERLSDVMLAQGFQDLTGQIMRPVVQLVGELTSSLEATLGIVRDERPEREESDAKGHGPAIKGLNDGQAVSGQQDVDDLMASLGL